MKKLFFVIVYLFFTVNTSRSDMVLGRAGPGPADYIGMGDTVFSVTFTPTDASKLNSLSMYMQLGGLSNVTDLTMKFSFNSDLSNHFAEVSANLQKFNGPHLKTFSFGQENGPVVGLEQNTVYFGLVSATNNVYLSDIFLLGQNSSDGLYGNWSAGASTSQNYYFFLDATAVPEPSTLAMMCFVMVLIFIIYSLNRLVY